MTAIPKDFGEAGADLDSSNGRRPTLVQTLRDIATDFATLKARLNSADIASADPTAVSAAALADPLITTADADATYGQPEADLINELKADVNITATLVNQLRATAVANRTLAIELKNEVSGITITSPDPTAISAAAVADPLITTADADATYGTPERDLINELKADVNTLTTLVNEIRTTTIETRTLLIEIKTKLNAAAPIGTLLTTLGD